MYDTLLSYNKKERIYNEMSSMHMKIYKTAPLQKETVHGLHPDNWQELIAGKDRRSHSKPGRFDEHHLSSWKVSKYKKVFSFIFWIFRNQKENKNTYVGIAEEKETVEGWTIGLRKSQNIAILTDIRNRHFVLLNIRLQQFIILNINNCSII